MKLREFYRVLASDPDLNLDSELLCSLTTCCGVQDSVMLDADKIEVDSDYVSLYVDVGSCREYGNKSKCKNQEMLDLVIYEMEKAGYLGFLLTSENEELREFIRKRLR